MNPTETDWASVVSQGLPAIAAILASAVAGLLQIWSKAGDRKHERKLKEEESHREDIRLAAQRDREYLESQRTVVKAFLQEVREQQTLAAEQQGQALEELKKLEETSYTDPTHIPVRIEYIGEVARMKLFKAWEELDGNLTDTKLRHASEEIGSALQNKDSYANADIFPGFQGNPHNPIPEFHVLLMELRYASADLLSRSQEQPRPENRSNGK